MIRHSPVACVQNPDFNSHSSSEIPILMITCIIFTKNYWKYEENICIWLVTLKIITWQWVQYLEQETQSEHLFLLLCFCLNVKKTNNKKPAMIGLVWTYFLFSFRCEFKGKLSVSEMITAFLQFQAYVHLCNGMEI